MARWNLLREALEQVNESVTYSWDEFNALVGGLPPSAKGNLAWWYGRDRPQVKAWEGAGFAFTNLVRGKTVTFVRRSAAGGAPGRPTPPNIPISSTREEGAPAVPVQTQAEADVVKVERTQLAAWVESYNSDRTPESRFASFDYCRNYFHSHRDSPGALVSAQNLQTACLELGFYLASWGMLRGSSGLLQRSVRYFVPLVEAIATSPRELWALDVDQYDGDGIDKVLWVASRVSAALHPINASDILVTKILLGVFGCVPAFDSYFKRGFGVSTFSEDSLSKIAKFYQQHADVIDQLRTPTLDFTTGQPTDLLYSRAKVIDMAFFMAGGYGSTT